MREDKKNKSERSFSIMLAEELLRAELKKALGDHLRIFQCDIKATPITEVHHRNEDISYFEREAVFNRKICERFVTLHAIIGPFEKVCPENHFDNRCSLRRIETNVRLYSSKDSNGDIWWRPHYLIAQMFNHHMIRCGYIISRYASGVVKSMVGNHGEDSNPCQDMCDSQTMLNYSLTKK